jgi:hypothetical protein
MKFKKKVFDLTKYNCYYRNNLKNPLTKTLSRKNNISRNKIVQLFVLHFEPENNPDSQSMLVLRTTSNNIIAMTIPNMTESINQIFCGFTIAIISLGYIHFPLEFFNYINFFL